MFFDTHAHFDAFADPAEARAALDRAEAARVGRVLAVGGSPDTNRAALEALAEWPGRVFAALGFDRDQASAAPSLPRLEADLARPGVVALGEIGLDYHYEPETAAAQKTLLAAQLEMARRRRLPVIVHSREADADTLALLGDHARAWPGDPERVGVLHCFTGSAEFAARLLDLGLMISFSGILTFRNADPLREVARGIPGDRLLIETDTPFLAPVPHRGKRNEPAWVVPVAEVLAKIRNDSLELIEHSTTANAERLFLGARS
ncbi:MAG TPA: TatD family hydrolase [Kiritimatiellia bacterium]|nr:TatD family hydrolase [Kiritimatiellia bacterium]HRZ13156.1 TatD family hydrolase [Kiritimatiellia bacterium]HSA17577.1 TatD family hydrolase [Kiritimatiellia bacterium]